MKKLSLILICALFLSTMVFAHGNMEHILGTITEITKHTLSVKTPEGEVKTVEFDNQTKFFKGEAAATVQDLRRGSRVSVHAEKRDNQLYAEEVKIGADAHGAH